MRYRYLTAAESDQVEAATFYESQQSGLGAEFIDEVDQTVQRILNQPYAGVSRQKPNQEVPGPAISV